MKEAIYNKEGFFYPSSLELKTLLLYIKNSEAYDKLPLVKKQRQYIIDYLNAL